VPTTDGSARRSVLTSTHWKEQTVNNRTQNRLFAALGIGSVVAELGAVVIGAAGGRPFATITSSPADIRSAFAKSVGVTAWIGAYLELLSVGMFLAFAVWAATRLGGGLLGAVAMATAAAYAGAGVAALGIGDALMYRAGHGMDVQLATTLITLQEAVYVGTWFLAVFYLLAVAPLALASGRRVIGWSAVAVSGIVLLTTAVSLDNFGQMSNFLWLMWIIATSIALARRPRGEATAAQVALA
jgi:hypothetical protein